MRIEKDKAIALRKSGRSYNHISQTLRVPKSTLSGWFRNLKISERVRDKNITKARQIWAQNITVYNKRRSLERRAEWLKTQAIAASEVGRLSKRELLLVGTALYWAEGYKKSNWNLVFCNSDPTMVKIALRFFIEICKVPRRKIKVKVQIHPNISQELAEQYWSKIIRLSKKQFLKPIHQVSKSSKNVRNNNLPYGTFRIMINDVRIVNRIKGWINGLAKS